MLSRASSQYSRTCTRSAVSQSLLRNIVLYLSIFLIAGLRRLRLRDALLRAEFGRTVVLMILDPVDRCLLGAVRAIGGLDDAVRGSRRRSHGIRWHHVHGLAVRLTECRLHHVARHSVCGALDLVVEEEPGTEYTGRSSASASCRPASALARWYFGAQFPERGRAGRDDLARYWPTCCTRPVNFACRRSDCRPSPNCRSVMSSASAWAPGSSRQLCRRRSPRAWDAWRQSHTDPAGKRIRYRDGALATYTEVYSSS